MGIMLVYDITDGKSFDSIGKWLRNIDEVCRIMNDLKINIKKFFFSLIIQNANEDVVRMIMGNKCDMEDKRVIQTERGQEVAKHHGIPFIETSAKTNINVTRAFHDITLKILEKVIKKFIYSFFFNLI